MKIVRINAEQETRLSGIRCDRCQAEARLHGDISGLFDFQEYLLVEFTSGYGAKAFDDGINYSCELCEQCVKDLLGKYLRATNSGWRQLFVPAHLGRNPSYSERFDELRSDQELD